MRLFAIFLTGLVFGSGNSLSGMIDPAKVLNFFDIAGHWDPSLAFVMAGALAVSFIGYRLVWQRSASILGGSFQLPTTTEIDRNLILGAALFGVGWGIAGFCPGAAIPAIATGRWEVLLFIACVVAGFSLRRFAGNANWGVKVVQ